MAGIDRVHSERVSGGARFTHASVKSPHIKFAKAPKVGLVKVAKMKAPKKVTAKVANPLKMKSHL